MEFTVGRNQASTATVGSGARRFSALAVVAVATVLIASACATNPATGGHNVVLTTVKGEPDQARRVHQEINQFYGLYEDQSVQDYVQGVGARVAAQTPIASWNFKFFVLDDDEVNAFAWRRLRLYP